MTKQTWRLAAAIGVLIAVAIGVWIWDANRVKPLGTKRVDLGNGVTMDFVWIPAGEFMMGSPTNEVGTFVSVVCWCADPSSSRAAWDVDATRGFVYFFPFYAVLRIGRDTLAALRSGFAT